MMKRELLTYTAVFVALLALLTLTYFARSAGVEVSLVIAGAKVALIAFFFMKLREQDTLGWAFATAGIVLGLLGTMLMLSDFLTRS